MHLCKSVGATSQLYKQGIALQIKHFRYTAMIQGVLWTCFRETSSLKSLLIGNNFCRYDTTLALWVNSNNTDYITCTSMYSVDAEITIIANHAFSARHMSQSSRQRQPIETDIDNYVFILPAFLEHTFPRYHPSARRKLRRQRPICCRQSDLQCWSEDIIFYVYVTLFQLFINYPLSACGDCKNTPTRLPRNSRCSEAGAGHG